MPFEAGETVGPYQILEQLGQGGMATVYKAYHASLDRHVAIKVLHSDLDRDVTFTARFQREARLIAKLDHPNIVPVHDFFEKDGHPCLVMKFIEGETLKDRLGRGPLSAQEIRHVLESTGAALAHAHRQGILHRDVKPSNVLIAKDGHIYLADFGLARLAQDGESTLSSDSIIGTPQYISPEQAIGKKELDEGTDIYSLGVMLYEMVVGQVPFSADTPMPIIFDHIYTPLPLPRTVNPSVPESVERVLLKALAKERSERYQTVPQLVTAFESAWGAAGVPMQGTAIRLPKLPAREAGNTPRGTKTPVAESTIGAGGGAFHRPKVKRPLWIVFGGGALILLCCALGTTSFGLLKQFWPIPTLAPTLTVTPTPFAFCDGEQTWLRRDYFPEQEISHCWDRDHAITDMAYDGNEWMIVMTKNTAYTDQAYVSGAEFPKARVKEYWDRDFDISNVSFGNGEWLVAMSKGSGFTNQSYFTDINIPDADIKDHWDQGYSITSLRYGSGGWVVVMSEGAKLGTQVYFTGTAFPDDKIRNYWDAGYDITSVAYGNSVWVVVMSQGSGFSNQYYYQKEIFPEDGIAEDWGNDFSITNLDYGNSVWIVVMSK